MTTCPRCHEPVLEPRPGLLLEPEPHQLGVHRADGSSLNSADIRARVQGHRKQSKAGHRPGSAWSAGKEGGR